jgi:hypothetical protein
MEDIFMVITMLISAAALTLVAMAMWLIMRGRARAKSPSDYERPFVRAKSRGAGRASGEDD